MFVRFLLLSVLMFSLARAHARPLADHELGLRASAYRQAVDHANPRGARFGQRFWTSSKFAEADEAPVLYRICGEVACERHIETDVIALFARELGAHVVYLEHRYYGSSQPYKDLSTGHLKYLSIDLAIEDLAEFQRSLTAQRGWRGAWIAVGGSYSGTLAAIYRLRHPDLVVGAWASSAPMYWTPLKAAEHDYSSEIRSTKLTDADFRQWTYQACSETYWWIAADDPRSPGEVCQKVFGFTLREDLAKYTSEVTRSFLDGTTESASQVLFTNGSSDPWAQIGFRPEDSRNSRIEVLRIEKAGHHDDLTQVAKDKQTPAVEEARESFVRLAKEWISSRR